MNDPLAAPITYGQAGGRGIASAAVAALIRLAPEEGVFAGFTAETSVANPASQRVLEKSGFSIKGTRMDAELRLWVRFIQPGNAS